MSSRASSGLLRKAAKAAASPSKTRKASTANLPVSKTGELITDHGRQIYVYNHLQTNQVVYSLSRDLKNNPSIKQLPYNGKKTVPAALRKDHWYPLALINFPTNSHGLTAFRQLREFRKLHETLWDPSLALSGKTKAPISRKERGKLLCDQKANSIADISAVLGKLDLKEVENTGDGVAPVLVKWKDMLDAEYAENWPEGVVHDVWETSSNHRKNRQYYDILRRQADREAAAIAAAEESAAAEKAAAAAAAEEGTKFEPSRV